MNEELKAAAAYVESLENKFKNLKLEIDDIDAQMTELNARRDVASKAKTVICSAYSAFSGTHKRGELVKARERYNKILRETEDKNKRAVVFVTDPWPVANHVVSRVTAKRVYIREVGDSRESYYCNTTGLCSWNGQIDIAKTFPEGVGNFANALKAKKL